MQGKGWKWLTLVGLGASLAAFTGCNEQSARENSRQVGREVGEATKEVQEGARKAAKEAHGAAREATQGFKEGRGGSGNPDAGVDAE
ncbi:hypothetical protein [Myxococcus virescens]|uniref:Lipoprotein n=1 Tax=Myxococcus virescens TaxID=83456 RepID=A0A511HEX6_9BACT|nr:hypothetical protein [Myxococcus virescens]GEL72025.1 hypothetical protein MVI01_38090 [Myxococcus virescens]SDE00112.1 hypothetical protein SAMN04488504_103603 [Myxococcus virescens]